MNLYDVLDVAKPAANPGAKGVGGDHLSVLYYKTEMDVPLEMAHWFFFTLTIIESFWVKFILIKFFWILQRNLKKTKNKDLKLLTIVYFFWIKVLKEL